MFPVEKARSLLISARVVYANVPSTSKLATVLSVMNFIICPSLILVAPIFCPICRCWL